MATSGANPLQLEYSPGGASEVRHRKRCLIYRRYFNIALAGQEEKISLSDIAHWATWAIMRHSPRLGLLLVVGCEAEYNPARVLEDAGVTRKEADHDDRL